MAKTLIIQTHRPVIVLLKLPNYSIFTCEIIYEFVFFYKLEKELFSIMIVITKLFSLQYFLCCSPLMNLSTEQEMRG